MNIKIITHNERRQKKKPIKIKTQHVLYYSMYIKYKKIRKCKLVYRKQIIGCLGPESRGVEWDRTEELRRTQGNFG